MLYIPPYFAHGFLVLSQEAQIQYKCTDYYNQSAESGLLYHDPEIGIIWPKLDIPIFTLPRDKNWQTLAEYKKKKNYER